MLNSRPDPQNAEAQASRKAGAVSVRSVALQTAQSMLEHWQSKLYDARERGHEARIAECVKHVERNAARVTDLNTPTDPE